MLVWFMTRGNRAPSKTKQIRQALETTVEVQNQGRESAAEIGLEEFVHLLEHLFHALADLIALLVEIGDG